VNDEDRDLLLAVDVGNTEVAMGLHGASGWAARWRLKTDPRRTVDEYRVVVAELLGAAGVRPAEVTEVVLSSVVPELTPVFRGMAEGLFGVSALVIAAGIRTGMDVRYEPAQSLGPDRLANAVAARERYGSPVVAIDFGTATTFSVVGIDGDFVGGAIAPGVGVAASALAASGARLRRIHLGAGPPPPVVGRTTEASMRSGVLYGYAGLVAGLLTRMESELSRRPAVVATGGMAAIMAPFVPRIDAVDPDLTLDGLRQLAELNR
jgi:type III pantothenate kinase